jgi:glutamate--cysteine ligase
MLDVFLLHCLVSNSPPDTPEEITALSRNQRLAAERGREPGLCLERNGTRVTLTEWGTELLHACTPIAATLDDLDGGRRHADALDQAAAALRNAQRLPSARVLQAMHSEHSGSHTKCTLAASARNRQALMALPFPASRRDEFARLARGSLDEQGRLEATETLAFEDFRRWYLDPARLRLP